ncbi:MAG: SpoIIE family protein phosphatase [Cytophagales bacterium]|mgnify:FL=1|uniref:GAF domain-containing SpoIIE family protein phosphatase n=1 Tax=Cyclobacterium marinum TaxID=104 RepID=UPI0011ED8D19|nr:SpoIIE family protein phosphatase [Cyclobacterium marinum]MBI0399374.1 SpoIIE family protein phosphatase [Cyclobacterium marinum]MBR9774287.1 SpoIIE family protein phosphatase [Cytophagales bacterium]|tara:strand:+ start:31204 stop:33273 length:2070 start_codon:yes stop_codon:yes gene_type:complete
MVKLPQIQRGKIYILLAVLSWMGLLLVNLIRVFGEINQMEGVISKEITWVLEILFFIWLYIYFNDSIKKNENRSFIDFIWRPASTGLIATGTSFLINFFYYLLGDSRLSEDLLLMNFFYHVNFAVVSIFLISTTLSWKHLILYQKSKAIVQQWQAYEVILLISMFFVLISQASFNYGFMFGLIFLIIYGAILSINLKWIPYLTFREKWKSILFMVIIIACTVYLFFRLVSYTQQNIHFVNLSENLFLLGLFVFVLLYAVFSLLVTLFNLPTSSVFEQKLTEAISFQKLSQSIKPGENEEQVLDILMDSCMSAAYVDAGWLELHPSEPEETSKIQLQKFISNGERQEVLELLRKVEPFSSYLTQRSEIKKEYLYGQIPHETYKSVLVLSVSANKKTLGDIFLLKEVKDGFNKEMINIISTFVGQTSISIENHRLLNEAIKNERYREELEIAQRVQRSLLPSELHHNNSFEIDGFSAAADEVGGDYYETFRFDNENFALIIGDVSGKGTSAAFNMSQMKGVFHSLVQLNLSPINFLSKANSALSRCLEKNNFITTTYYTINTSLKEIYFARAGHCPTLFYSLEQGCSRFLNIKGMGLGIVRNEGYENYLEEGYLKYRPGDVMVMYTDGIVEAKNQENQEFGYDKLRLLLDHYKTLPAKEIKSKIVNEVYDFVGREALPDDDYSILVIKFNA